MPRTCLLVATGALVLGACQGEDRPANVDVIGGGGFVSVSGADDSAGGVPAGIRYTATSNQDLAAQAALDLRDLRSVINLAIDGRPVDWARAQQLYEVGRNQRLPDGSTRSLASLADSEAHAQFPPGAALYGRPAFIDGLVRDGLLGRGLGEGRSENARRQLVERGVQMLLYARTLHALAEAEALITSDPAGAAAAIDRAWAYVAGPADADGARLASLLGVAINLENAASQPGRLSRPLEAAFITALAAAQKGDRATFDRYTAEARGELATIFYTGTLRPLAQATAASSEAIRDALLAESLASFQSIRATVATVSPSAATAIPDALERSPSQPPTDATDADVASVYRALNEPTVLQALGIPTGFQLATPPAVAR